jgi:catechol 2,3-dioxygenase-like lactoylglutathione lyase family enzyme
MGAGFTPLGLDHIVLRVRDQEVSKRFYCDLLGCTVDHINEPIKLVQLRFGEQLIDLLPEAAAAPRGGLDHFCLSIRCDDLGKLADELRRREVVVDGDVVSRRGAYGQGPSIYIRDPDDYRVELKPR